MTGWGWFAFLIFLLLVIGEVSWIVYIHRRAKKNGLSRPTWQQYIPFSRPPGSTNYPSPRSRDALEWVKDQFSKLTHRRTARGNYEDASADGNFLPSGRRGRAEDDDWDTRVGNEDPYGPGPGGYGYEEQELGLSASNTGPYAGGPSPYDENRGRQGRSPAPAAGHARGLSANENPFGDQNEAPSLRGVSPRPEPDAKKGHTKGMDSLDSAGSAGSSPTGTRKSAFRETLD